MLTANGSVQTQLKFHMVGFLNAGGQPRALAELMFVSAGPNRHARLRLVLVDRGQHQAPVEGGPQKRLLGFTRRVPHNRAPSLAPTS
jgi:hypothetical protein